MTDQGITRAMKEARDKGRSMAVHAIRLPHADYLKVGNSNEVSEIAYAKASLFRNDTAESLGWFYQRDGSGMEPVPTPADLQLRIAEVLEAEGSGMLRVRLRGDRYLVVPMHHWPVFQVVTL